MTAWLEDRGNGNFAVGGQLDFHSVTELWSKTEWLSKAAKSLPVRVDLAAVTHSNSAGVALLVAWLQRAQERQQTLLFVNLPQQMQCIIQIAALNELLGISISSPSPGDPIDL